VGRERGLDSHRQPNRLARRRRQIGRRASSSLQEIARSPRPAPFSVPAPLRGPTLARRQHWARRRLPLGNWGTLGNLCGREVVQTQRPTTQDRLLKEHSSPIRGEAPDCHARLVASHYRWQPKHMRTNPHMATPITTHALWLLRQRLHTPSQTGLNALCMCFNSSGGR